MAAQKSTRKSRRPKGLPPPAKTKEGRESQLVNLAVDLAEKQLFEGTASSQVITHYLKLGTIRAELETRKLKHETELTQAKIEALQSAKRIEALYEEALTAMRSYAGQNTPDEVDDD